MHNTSFNSSQTPEQGDTKSPQSKEKGFLGKVKEWCELVKIEHTVFALPFALSGLILASARLPSASVVLLTIICFAGARAAAMSLNRAIDADMDARNPRTKDRAVAKGVISKGAAILFAVVAFAVMIVAAIPLPAICLKLSPIAVIWLSFYSFTKRFTWLCHFVLGIALGGAALGGWAAAGGELNILPPYLLALAVASWVAGFDLIYACQDFEFDRLEKVHSIPAQFGIGSALNTSNALHVITTVSLIALGSLLHLGAVYWVGVTIVTVMLVYEHSIVKANDLSRVNAAFFNVNGIVSILAFVSILIDKLVRLYSG
jgi:4-hydroxybenzoate polyprenyltransferase